MDRLPGSRAELTVLRRMLRRAIPLGAGEGLARLARFSVVVLIGRRIGVEALGIYALGQTAAQYVLLGTDFGLKAIGARLLVVSPGRLGSVARSVQSRRLRLAMIAYPAALLYAALGPVPREARGFVIAFVISTIPATFALDWLLQGRERFVALGAWRASIAVIFLGVAVLGLMGLHYGLLSVAAANALAYGAGSAFLWVAIWRGRGRPGAWSDADRLSSAGAPVKIAWGQIWWMGLAWLLNQMFNNFDVIMLGALSTSSQVGLYNAAYKLIYLVLGVYYLLTQVAFPVFARWDGGTSAKRHVVQLAMLAGLVGVAVAGGCELAAPTVVQIVYGRAFGPSGELFQVLLLALPLDFVVSLFGTALMAWNHPRRVAASVGMGAAANIGLNLYLIPAYGARGAAVATVISYGIALAVLTVAFLRVKSRAAPSAQLPERTLLS